MAEGEAEKAAQTALAADAEISLTPTRTERDADFRAVLRQAPATPVPAANLAREVMQAAISAKTSGSIELHIDPVELGKLDIEFSVIDDRMTIIVRAERDEALDLMRRNSDDLEKMLREAGVDLGSLSFSQGGSDDPQQKNRFGVAGLAGESAVSDGPASVLPSARSTDRLDIRV
jgi:flagellar hook-length control protein FliK